MSEIKAYKRVEYIDYIRALCMVWIVGFWHIGDYSAMSISTNVTSLVTLGVLGAFTYISGYFLGKKRISTISDVWTFYKKRFLRIYPMFFVSCISLYAIRLIAGVGTIVSLKQLLLTLTGLSCIITPAPSTIWYVSMLVLFYLLTPVIISRSSLFSKAAVCVGIYGIFILLMCTIGIDDRVLLWFPMYALGLLTAGINFSTKFDYRLAVLSLIGYVGMIYLKESFLDSYVLNGVAEFIIAGLFVIFLMQAGKLLEAKALIGKILRPISYASMCAYLFHRQYYGAWKILIGQFPVWTSFLVILPSLLILCYIAQRIYDYLIDRLIKK